MVYRPDAVVPDQGRGAVKRISVRRTVPAPMGRWAYGQDIVRGGRIRA